MKISELITKLQAVQAEHGDLLALSENGECDYDEHPYLGVAKFVASGNKHCGGNWSIVDKYDNHPFKTRTLAAYLSYCRRD